MKKLVVALCILALIVSACGVHQGKVVNKYRVIRDSSISECVFYYLTIQKCTEDSCENQTDIRVSKAEYNRYSIGDEYTRPR